MLELGLCHSLHCSHKYLEPLRFLFFSLTARTQRNLVCLMLLRCLYRVGQLFLIEDKMTEFVIIILIYNPIRLLELGRGVLGRAMRVGFDHCAILRDQVQIT